MAAPSINPTDQSPDMGSIIYAREHGPKEEIEGGKDQEVDLSVPRRAILGSENSPR